MTVTYAMLLISYFFFPYSDYACRSRALLPVFRGDSKACIPGHEFVMLGYAALFWLGIPSSSLPLPSGPWRAGFGIAEFLLVFFAGAAIGKLLSWSAWKKVSDWLTAGLVGSLTGGGILLVSLIITQSCVVLYSRVYYPEEVYPACVSPLDLLLAPLGWWIFGAFDEARDLIAPTPLMRLVLIALRTLAWLAVCFLIGALFRRIRRFRKWLKERNEEQEENGGYGKSAR